MRIPPVLQCPECAKDALISCLWLLNAPLIHLNRKARTTLFTALPLFYTGIRLSGQLGAVGKLSNGGVGSKSPHRGTISNTGQYFTWLFTVMTVPYV